MTNPVPDPLPYRTRLEVGQQVIALVTQTWTDGAFPSPGDGLPWTPTELAEALYHAVNLWAGFARYVHDTAAEGQTPDPQAFLQRAALNLAENPPSGPFPASYRPEDPDPW